MCWCIWNWTDLQRSVSAWNPSCLAKNKHRTNQDSYLTFMENEKFQLYTYWRSSCSWRVRIVLNLHGIPFDSIPIHLAKGDQLKEYKAINPNATVPALVTPKGLITQSTAIIEYLEETGNIKLLPQDPYERSQVRSIMNLIACDIQPVQNLRVLKYVGDTKQTWACHFITLGFEALEAILSKTSGKYSYGNSLTLADVYLIPQVYNAIR